MSFPSHDLVPDSDFVPITVEHHITIFHHISIRLVMIGGADSSIFINGAGNMQTSQAFVAFSFPKLVAIRKRQHTLKPLMRGWRFVDFSFVIDLWNMLTFHDFPLPEYPYPCWVVKCLLACWSSQLFATKLGRRHRYWPAKNAWCNRRNDNNCRSNQAPQKFDSFQDLPYSIFVNFPVLLEIPAIAGFLLSPWSFA